ncbi:MAG: amino acid adenylation domain-containing protein [Cyanobacteria bacterium P01_G01_bin.19]
MASEDKKLELLKQRIANLPPEKRAIFERKLKEQKLGEQSTIQSLQDKDNLELSYAQSRLWFLSQLEPDNPTYNIAIAWKIEGDLDIDVFNKVWLTIIQRHETLRTTFVSSEAGKPQIKVNNITKLYLPIVDLSNSENLELEVKNTSQEIARQSFDLEREIPIRLNLLKASDREYNLVLVLHHIVADGWSRGILLKEFSTLYKAFINKSPNPLAEIEIKYTDYAAWEKQWIESEEYQGQLDYWTKQLADLPILDLPTDLPRPTIQTSKGKTEFFQISAQLTAELKSLSRQQGVTLFMTLLTAFKILLHRYTGQKNIAVGSPIANRNLKEVSNLIGLFVNTLVLRSDLSNNPSFTDLLSQIKTTTNQAYQNQELPFGKIVEALHPERNLSQNPLFQVMIQFQNQAYQQQNSLSPEFALPELNLTQEWIDTGATKFDLTFHLIERESGIMTAIEYRSDLYHPETIQRMFGHFQTLLNAIALNPQARISELPILTPAETQQILIDWNQTASQIPEACFYQLFEQQVLKTPNNIAVETLSGESLTYEKLNQKANELAHYLSSQGVKLETKVGICLERSPELIIALLAIQKAGGTYIPLDPNYPQARLNYIVEDSQIEILLTQTKYQNKFANKNITVIPLPITHYPLPITQNKPITHYSLPITHPDNLAYIIYTSGSTGKPKGTMITHQGLVNYLTWAIDKYPIASGNGFPVHSSISFDATITSLYTALLVGQKIILFSETNEIETLKDVLNSDKNYSAIKLTPAHLKAIASISDSEAPANPAQTFILGGEALTKDAIAYWQQRAPDAQFINEYGPTETVVGCCTYEISRENISHYQIPIGNPIANTQLYILDEYLQPTPIGIPGELYIGGNGVARGYLQQPGLTAERFIPNPFSLNIEHLSLRDSADSAVSVDKQLSRANIAPSASLLYKTGDHAKYQPDGTIEYLGRLDNQVKIRGYRIELGEIEAVLNQHPNVQTSLVTVNKDRLIAYIIPNASAPSASPAPPAPSAQQLRQYLTQKLPAYMIPRNFMLLDRFPLTANGKIDKAALPIPNLEVRETEIVEPRTEKERILVKIWREVLNLEKIGIADNFFDLGGDSILSIQIIARARQAGLTLTPKQLFQYQTIAELAAIAEESKPIVAEQDLVIGKVPLTPIQHWFFERDLVNFSHYNQAVLLEVAPNLNSEWLQLAIQHLVSHHDALRMRFVRDDSGWQQFNLEEVEDIDFVTVDFGEYCLSQSRLSLLSREDGTNGGKVAEKDKESRVWDEFILDNANELQASLDISQGKLVAGALFKRGEGKLDRLLLVIHHLLVDGVSWRILLEDIAIAYHQLAENRSIQLPAKTTSYKYWAESLLEYAQKIEVEKELSYWLNRKAIASIPVDKLSSDNTVASSKEISVVLDTDNTNSLLTKVSKTYNTNVEDILLTALLQNFYFWTGEKHLQLNLESYGREQIAEDIDISRTVGWFTTIYPVQLFSASIHQLGETIKSVKEQLRISKTKGFNYSILKYLDSDSRARLKQISPSQISFNYLGQLKPPPTESIIKGLAQEGTGKTQHSESQRNYLIEINSAIANNKLEINWVYSENYHYRSTIEKLANNYLQSLKDIIQHCLSPQATSYTPSDFSAAKVNQSQLDKLMGQINKQK